MASGGEGGPSGGVVKEGWLQKRGKPTSEKRESVDVRFFGGGWSSR